MSIVASIPWLESVDAKLDRAHHHRKAIDEQILAFLNATTDDIIVKTDPVTDEAALMWSMTSAQHPDLSISVEIGEFLYNLRSALDNLVCALVRSHKPASSCAKRGFPIHTDSNMFERDAPTLLRDVHPSARTLIQGLQPYGRGPETASIDPLNILNKLRNRDTHRALNLGAIYNRDTRFVISSTATGKFVTEVVIPHTIRLRDDSQKITLSVPASEMPENMDLQVHGQRGVAFRDDGPWGERDVRKVLGTCLEHVEERVIAQFKPFFG